MNALELKKLAESGQDNVTLTLAQLNDLRIQLAYYTTMLRTVFNYAQRPELAHNVPRLQLEFEKYTQSRYTNHKEVPL